MHSQHTDRQGMVLVKKRPYPSGSWLRESGNSRPALNFAMSIRGDSTAPHVKEGTFTGPNQTNGVVNLARIALNRRPVAGEMNRNPALPDDNQISSSPTSLGISIKTGPGRPVWAM